MSYRRRSAPVSSLRASLQQRLDEKNSWAGESDFSLDDSAEASKPFSPAAILMTMHRYLLLKSTVAIVVVFTAAVLIRGGYGWGAPLLQALRFVVEWDLNLDSFSEKVVPAFRLIQDRVERPLNEPEALSPGEPPCPFAGSLQSGFGLRADAVAGRDQMHYGIDLVAPEGTAVERCWRVG